MYKLTEKQKKEFEFFKENDDDKVMFVLNQATKVGVIEFTFDKETIYNFFGDYPDKLTKAQREIFDKEQPYLKENFT